MKRQQFAKLTRPRLHDAIARERLFRLLDEKCTHPVVWICGPPGSGKTTLAASYLEQAARPVLWYQVDSGDSDPATFFVYLRQLVIETAGDGDSPLPLLTHEYLSDIPGFTRRFLRDAFSKLPPNVVLVFDNYHEIVPESPLHAALAAGSGEVPQSATILLVSRSHPPAAFAHPLINEVITRITWDDLKFSVEEAAAIARARGLTDRETVKAIHIQTDGWVAGLALMLERFKRGGGPRAAVRAETLETIFDYFSTVIFENASEESRTVMLKTALLPRVTGPLAEAVTGIKTALKHVDDLYRRHMFTDRSAGTPDVYQYHGLFRAYLRARADAVLSVDERSAARRVAARELEAQGNLEDAFALYADAAYWDGAERVLVACSAELSSQGRWQTLQEWVRALPEERIKGNTWVRYWLGYSQVFVEPVGARSVLEKAHEIFTELGDETGALLSATAVLEALYVDFREFRLMDPWIARVAELLERRVTLPSREDELRAFSVLLMGATYRVPDHPLFKAWIRHVEKMLQEPLDPNLRVGAASMLQGYAVVALDADAEQLAIRVAHSLLDSPKLKAWPAAFYIATEGFTHYVHGRYELALASFDRADAISSDHGLDDVSLKSAVWRVVCSRRAGRLEEAEETIRRVESMRNHRRISLVTPMGLLKAVVAFDRGDFERAVSGALTAVNDSTEGGQYNAMMLVRLTCANILIAAGKLERARCILRAARSDVTGPTTGNFLGVIAVNQAWLEHRRGAHAERNELLREALQLARDDRVRVRFRWHTNALSELLPVAIAQGIDPKMARGLAREFQVIPSSPFIEDWPWPVKIYTLGKFELLVHEKAPEFSRKTPRKALALLKAIIALGGREIPEQRLTDLLWADEDGDGAHRALTAMIHRVRVLLRDSHALQHSGGKLSLNSARCWVDAYAFQHFTSSSDANREYAIDLYRGAFLPQEEESWVVPLREKLRAKHVEAVTTHAQSLLRSGRLEAAIGCYLQGLEADDVAESFYQGLMQCYQRDNRRVEAVDAYRRLSRLLSIRIGTKPSPSTERIYQSLVAR